MSTTRYRLDPIQFGAVFALCKENPVLGYKLGYTCTGHMLPETFIKLNGIELIDGEPEMTQVIDYDKLIHGELVVVG